MYIGCCKKSLLSLDPLRINKTRADYFWSRMLPIHLAHFIPKYPIYLLV